MLRRHRRSWEARDGEAKAAGKATKAPKIPKTKKSASTLQRAAAVEKNIGKSQSLHDFLTGIGWR
jgi:hypothetical protein